jgi:hypothetical protein
MNRPRRGKSSNRNSQNPSQPKGQSGQRSPGQGQRANQQGDEQKRPDSSQRGGRRGRGRYGKSRNRQDKNRSESNQTKDLRLTKDPEPIDEEPPKVWIPKSYGVLLFDTLAEAQGSLEVISEKAKSVDQLNVVVRAEDNAQAASLKKVDNVKYFCGNAWTIIHERRIADGWYEEKR